MPTLRCARPSRRRSTPSPCRCSCPAGSTTTVSSIRAIPAPCSECVCPPSQMARSRGRRTSASSGCERHASDLWSISGGGRRSGSTNRRGGGSEMITRVLVANRGEIARRVFATCRRLGIGTVAVYTDPDAASPHVAEADARVRLEGRNGYLDAAQLIDAARAASADAIHPGYGFLSENAEFASAVIDAGLTWIGPPVAAVAAMGSKIEAKKMMAAAGVPVLDELDPDTVTAAQLPVLIK